MNRGNWERRLRAPTRADMPSSAVRHSLICLAHNHKSNRTVFANISLICRSNFPILSLLTETRRIRVHRMFVTRTHLLLSFVGMLFLFGSFALIPVTVTSQGDDFQHVIVAAR